MTEISNEYGSAFFALALELQKQIEFGKELSEIDGIFSEHPEYSGMLASPSIPMKERLNAIDKAFSSEFSEETVSFLKLLCEKGRIVYLHECVKQYEKLLDASQRTSSVTVTSAVELDAHAKEKLISALELKYNCKISAQYRIDSTLLGGLTVEFDGRVIDGSLRHRLKEVKDVISQ